MPSRVLAMSSWIGASFLVKATTSPGRSYRPDRAGRCGGPVYSIEEIVKTDPCETALDSAVVLAAQQSLDKHGKATEVGGFPAGCDMSKLVLWAGIPSVILGPGSLAQAHGPDEYVEVEQVRVATLVYEDMARSFLRGEQ